MSPHQTDSDDPWTFFGSFSKVEIDGAVRLLTEARIRFEVKEEPVDPGSGWSGPFALWEHDDAAAQASEVLVPYFRREQGNG